MYIKETTKYLDFPAGIFPTLSLPAASPGIADNKIIANNIANNYFKDRDFALVRMLYCLRFATFAQLCKLLGIAKDDEATFRNRLNQLQSKRIINKFTLARDEDATNQPDALAVYCLDYAGVQLAYHRFQNNKILNYDISMNMVDSTIVGKQLFVVDFYLKLLDAVGKENIEIFNPDDEYTLNRTYDGNRATSFRFKPGFVFSIKKDGKIKNYVCGVFSKDEMGVELIDEIKIYNEFLPKMRSCLPETEKDTAPTLLLFVNNDEAMAVAASSVLMGGENIKTFRLSTPDRLVNGLDKAGAFCKLDPATNTITGVTMAAFKK